MRRCTLILIRGRGETGLELLIDPFSLFENLLVRGGRVRIGGRARVGEVVVQVDGGAGAGLVPPDAGLKDRVEELAAGEGVRGGGRGEGGAEGRVEALDEVAVLN